MTRRGPFRVSDRVQLTDPKGRMHTITLAEGKEFHTHRGFIRHNDLLGVPDGSTITNTVGVEYLAIRPLLSDYVMSMPRGAAVVYPKDAGQIIQMGDICPGAVVVEDHDRDTGILQLHLHLERPDAVVGQDDARVEVEDRLGLGDRRHRARPLPGRQGHPSPPARERTAHEPEQGGHPGWSSSRRNSSRPSRPSS